MDPMVPFPPVIELDLPGAFITKHPRETIAENTDAVPLVTGITFDEGALKSARKETFFNIFFDRKITFVGNASKLKFYFIQSI